MTNTEPQTDKGLFEILAKRIRQGNCALFLGPGMLQTNGGELFNKMFARKLAALLKQDDKITIEPALENNMSYMITRYLYQMNLPYKDDVVKMIDVRDLYIAEYNQSVFDDSIFRELAAFNFPLVINVNTDDRFFEIFRQKQAAQQREVQFDFYDMSNRETVERKKKNYNISVQSPLVYNVFGHCSEEHLNSLILSEKEQISFAGSIHQANMLLPADITQFFSGEDKYCLFIGFDYDEWVLKILIRALWSGENANSRNPLPNAMGLGTPSAYQSVFYLKEYKFCFVNNNIKQFLQEMAVRAQAQPMPPPPQKNATPKQPCSIMFIFDYSNTEDLAYRNRLSDHLRPFMAMKKFTLWSEDIVSGADKDAKRKEKFETADIVIWLVSGDFTGSGKNALVAELLACNTKKHLKNIAVLVRPALYSYLKEMKDFSWQPLPDAHGEIKAIAAYSSEGEQDALLVQAAEYIINVAEEIGNL